VIKVSDYYDGIDREGERMQRDRAIDMQIEEKRLRGDDME